MSTHVSEIDLSPCKLKFNVYEDGLVSSSLEGSAPVPMKLYQVCISFDRKLIDFIPMTDLAPAPPIPRPSLLAFLISDQNGMFGRTCRSCDSYFRTSMIDIRYHSRCPYCLHGAPPIEFTTDNQLRFFDAYLNSFLDAHEKKKELEFDIADLSNDLPNNHPTWVYKEERQEEQFKCTSCKNTYDILGKFAACPNCGRQNSREVFAKEVDIAKGEIGMREPLADDDINKKISADKIQKLFTPFEAMGNHLFVPLKKLPTTPRRRNQYKSLSFQRIFQASELLDKFFGFKLMRNVSTEKQSLLKLLLAKRHIATHNASRVDEQYLNTSGDTTAKLHSTISTTNSELAELSKILKLMAGNLIDDYESII